MERNEIFEKIKKITCEEMQVEESQISEAASFEGDLQADSLDVVQISMKIEEEFNIEIPDEELSTIKTVGDAVNFVEGRLGSPAQG